MMMTASVVIYYLLKIYLFIYDLTPITMPHFLAGLEWSACISVLIVLFLILMYRLRITDEGLFNHGWPGDALFVIVGWTKSVCFSYSCLIKYILTFNLIIEINLTRHMWQLGKLSRPILANRLFWRVNFPYPNQTSGK